MKHLCLIILLCLTGLCSNAQYSSIYENNFRNWQPGQDWVIINNDTISQSPGLVTESYINESVRYALGICNLNNHGIFFPPTSINGICDKTIISPPVILGNNPWVQFYSRHHAASEYTFWVISNPNDTSLTGLTDSIGSTHLEGFNAFDLSSFANDTVRLAWRLKGTGVYGYIDDLNVVERTSMAYIPDACFRTYMQGLIPNAFIADSLDYFHYDAINVTNITSPNSCIQSLEGLQHFKHVKILDVINNQISSMPLNTFYYIDSLKVVNNYLTVLPDMPRCMHINAANNLISKFPDYFNQTIGILYMNNNLIYDCLPPTNRMVYGNMCNNLSVNFTGGTYYSMACRTSYPNPVTNCTPITGMISGLVYYDLNQNNIYDSSDIVLRNQRIDFMQGSDIISNISGQYGLRLVPGYINMNVTQLPAYFSCTNPLNDSLSAQQVINHNFRIVAPSPVTDLEMILSTTGTARSGENLLLNLSVRNLGTDIQTGFVSMTIPTGYTLLDPGAATVSNGIASWSPSVLPFRTQNTAMLFLVDTVITSTMTRFIANVQSAGDINSANDTFQTNVMVFPALTALSPWNGGGFPFDPNNKIVSTPRVDQGFDDYLYYNINFENIGTANASRVMVRDVLRGNFDLRSFEYIASSHPCVVSLSNDSILQFLFQPIVLTPTSIDSVNSQGHIWFRIKPATPMQVGDTLRNSASIYFDNEAPVITDVCKVWVESNIALSSNTNNTCVDETVSFIDQSTATTTSWQWTFPGGTPSSSTLKNPHVVYSSPGVYDVSMVVNWNGVMESVSMPAFITITSAPTANITSAGPLAFCAGNDVELISDPATSYLWSNGETTQNIFANISGNYTVTITDAKGCSATSAAQNVTVYPSPSANINSSGALSFCDGENVILTSDPASSYLWSGGETTQDISVNTSGNYSVIVTDANGCTNTSSTVVVTVNPLPVANINSNGPLTFCDGGNLVLTSDPATSYLWSTGDTTQDIIVYTSGNYSVIVTDVNGCSNTSSAIVVTVNPLPVANINSNGALTFCNGGNVVLTSDPASTYLWSTGDTTQHITVNISGNYSVSITDVNGCSGISSDITVTAHPNPTTAVITLSNDTLHTSGGATYQWYLNGILISGAENPYFIPTVSGNYTVVITDINSCESESAIFTFILSGVAWNFGAGELQIFPNPNYGIFEVVSNSDEKKSVEIKDLLGRVVYAQQHFEKRITIDLASVAKGVYILNFFDDVKMISKKVVVQ